MSRFAWFLPLLTGVACAAFRAADPATTFDFGAVPPGALPAGFVAEATTPVGPLATWEVVAEGEGRALRMTKPNHDELKTFNLCWSKDVVFRDGTLEVRVRAETGEDDQGGGLLWRAIDANNYYTTRFNPLESNLRLYYVKDGVRKQIGGVRVEGVAGTWFTLRVDHHGDHIRVAMDGKPLLDVRDATFPAPGGVGFWTKADAVTTFDDLRVTPGAAEAK
jgi:hypothetical protein